MDDIVTDKVINLIPPHWRSTVLLLGLISPFLGRAYHAIVSGGGLRGVISAIWLGTNTPKKGTDGTSGTGGGAAAALLLCASLGLTGCAALAPGADPIEVRAEQAVSVAADTFDTFLKLEYEEISLVRSNAPAVHQFAEWLRTPTVVGTNIWPRDIALVQAANAVRLTYKSNRTADNKASLTTALATLESTLNQAQAQLTALGMLGVTNKAAGSPGGLALPNSLPGSPGGLALPFSNIVLTNHP